MPIVKLASRSAISAPAGHHVDEQLVDATVPGHLRVKRRRQDGTLPDRVFGESEKMEFLGGLDFLVLAMPLTKATEGLVGEKELSALPPRAFVLNPARGPIIQQAALLRALREKWIAGAALDTHYHYPMPPDHPLWKFPNVIFTPHISGSSLSPMFKTRLWDIFALNLERITHGQPLLNELTAAQLAGA